MIICKAGVPQTEMKFWKPFQFTESDAMLRALKLTENGAELYRRLKGMLELKE